MLLNKQTSLFISEIHTSKRYFIVIFDISAAVLTDNFFELLALTFLQCHSTNYDVKSSTTFMSFIAYFLIIFNIDLLLLIDTFVACMLSISLHERYI